MTQAPKTLVYFHGEDSDGWAAAYAAWLAYGEQGEYVPVEAGEFDRAGPSLPKAAGRDVVVLDLALSPAVLAKLAEAAQSLLVIDHHASAAGIGLGAAWPGVTVVHDTTKAACVLAWEFFCPGKPVPELYRYIADRDLWTWRLDHSRAINAGLAGYPLGFDTIGMGLASLGQLRNEGEAVLRAVQTAVVRQAAHATLQHVAGHDVPCVNATSYVSEIGEALLAAHPQAPFAATFAVRVDGTRVWSFRSRTATECDVGALARRLGGGGHACAAGCSGGPNDPHLAAALAAAEARERGDCPGATGAEPAQDKNIPRPGDAPAVVMARPAKVGAGTACEGRPGKR